MSTAVEASTTTKINISSPNDSMNVTDSNLNQTSVNVNNTDNRSGRLLELVPEIEQNDLPEGFSELQPDSYLLLEDYQDRDAAFRWNTANKIRKNNKSIKDKIIEYLRLNVGKHVTGEELRYLVKDKSEWPRRIRELRTEEGWPILTKVSGNPDLPVGVYVLEEDKQAEKHDRRIPDGVRVDVLTRDKHSCRKCSWRYSDQAPGDPRRILELHHIVHHANKGENTTDNLITLCNVHHDQVHSGQITDKELLDLLK